MTPESPAMCVREDGKLGSPLRTGRGPSRPVKARCSYRDRAERTFCERLLIVRWRALWEILKAGSAEGEQSVEQDSL